MSIKLTTFAYGLAALLLPACTRVPRSTADVAVARREACASRVAPADSLTAVTRARSLLDDAASPPRLVVRTMLVLEEGYVIRLLRAEPGWTRGDGGLVWVDRETACATVLVRYE